MRGTALAAMLLFSGAALSDHVDVIEFTLNEDCSRQQYLEIVSDFREDRGSKNGYQAEVLTPIQSHNLTSMFWVGRSANAAAYGEAWDTWRKDLSNPNSVASKLWTRFQECSTNISRRGYDTN